MNRTVLFVDDEPVILKAILRILRKEPYAVLTASSGVDALRMMAEAPIDVLVSDENMPGMNGSELLRRVRRDHPEVIRILLSGGAAPSTAGRRARSADLYRILVKPVTPDELARTLRQALATKAGGCEPERRCAR